MVYNMNRKCCITISVKVYDCWIEDDYKGSPIIHILISFADRLHLISKRDTNF